MSRSLRRRRRRRRWATTRRGEKRVAVLRRRACSYCPVPISVVDTHGAPCWHPLLAAAALRTTELVRGAVLRMDTFRNQEGMDFAALFRKIDHDGSGWIEVQEMKTTLAVLWPDGEAEAVQAVFGGPAVPAAAAAAPPSNNLSFDHAAVLTGIGDYVWRAFVSRGA
jgi:hypothetical protein